MGRYMARAGLGDKFLGRGLIFDGAGVVLGGAAALMAALALLVLTLGWGASNSARPNVPFV